MHTLPRTRLVTAPASLFLPLSGLLQLVGLKCRFVCVWASVSVEQSNSAAWNQLCQHCRVYLAVLCAESIECIHNQVWQIRFVLCASEVRPG